MLDRRVIVFVEVKTRTGHGFGSPFEAVEFRKQRKMIQAAQYFLDRKKLHQRDARFDVVGISWPGATGGRAYRKRFRSCPRGSSMLDVKLLRENLDEVKAAHGDARRRGRLGRVRCHSIASGARRWRTSSGLKEKKNRLSGEIGKLKKSGGDASALMREGEEVSEAIRDSEAPLAEIEARFERFMLTLAQFAASER